MYKKKGTGICILIILLLAAGLLAIAGAMAEVSWAAVLCGAAALAAPVIGIWRQR